jgi:hypothetical protein
MLLQVTQYKDSLDSLTQTTGQDQTGLFLLIAGGAIVLIVIIWVLVRQGTKTQPGQIHIQSSTSKTKQPVSTDNKSKTVSTKKSVPEQKAKETLGKEKPATSKTEKLETEKDKITETSSDPKNPETIEPLPEEQSQPKYIGYNPINIFEQTEPYNFPYVIMPKPECIIKFPRKGRTGRKGFKEDDFKTYLTRHFRNAFKIYDDRFITVKENRKPYEPDISFTDEKNGINIFLDIEVDEPYEGINDIALRKATHFQYVDTNRNNAFKKRGWIVIRFAEIQVHQEPLQCCLFVADVIKSIHPKFEIPDALFKVHEVTPLKQWTREEAEQWSKEKYREKYLDLPKGFGFVPETEKFEGVQETELGEVIESEVEDEPPFIPPNNNTRALGNPKYNLIETAIKNSKYVSFIYNGKPTITKPIRFIGQDKLLAFCYVKNIEREFELYHVNSLSEKSLLYTTELTSQTIDLEKVKGLIRMAIKYNKFLRMRYTRGSWTDLVTGEFKDAEQSLRTISGIGLAKDVLEEEHVNQYNLTNDTHLNAFCNRDDVRKTFRFDRINEIAVLNI